jgi:hypothetical protein
VSVALVLKTKKLPANKGTPMIGTPDEVASTTEKSKRLITIDVFDSFLINFLEARQVSGRRKLIA